MLPFMVNKDVYIMGYRYALHMLISNNKWRTKTFVTSEISDLVEYAEKNTNCGKWWVGSGC